MERFVWRQVTIPKGMSSLLELICTETLRHNPDCIYSFIADLLEKEYEAEVDRSQQEQRRRDEVESNGTAEGRRPAEVTSASVINIGDDTPSPQESPQKPSSSSEDERAVIAAVPQPPPVSLVPQDLPPSPPAQVTESPPAPDEDPKSLGDGKASPSALEEEIRAFSAVFPTAETKSEVPEDRASPPVVEATSESSSVSPSKPESLPASPPPTSPPLTKPVSPPAPSPPANSQPASPFPASESQPSSPPIEETKPVSPPTPKSPPASPPAPKSLPASPPARELRAEPAFPAVEEVIVSSAFSAEASVPPQASPPVSSPEPATPKTDSAKPEESIEDQPLISLDEPSAPTTAEPPTPKKVTMSPEIVSFIETSSEPLLGESSRLSVEDREEIEKLLDQTLNTQEIQELLQSGEFLDVVEPEENANNNATVESKVAEKQEQVTTVGVAEQEKRAEEEEQLFKSQKDEPEYDDGDEEEEEEEDSEEDSEADEEDDDDNEDMDDNDSEVGKIIKANLTAAVEAEGTAAGELSSSDVDPNEAATRIQANFRGYRARKNLQAAKKERQGTTTATVTTEEASGVTDSSPDRSSADLPPEPARRRVGFSRIRNSGKYRSGVVFDDPEDEKELLEYDGEYLQKAATKIQANIRGFLTRKEYQKEMETIKAKKQAATKIQATVRGFLTRRRLQRARLANRRRSSHGGTLTIQRRGSLKLDQAATKIQAAFRGYHVRRARSKNVSESGESASRVPAPASLEATISEAAPESPKVTPTPSVETTESPATVEASSLETKEPEIASKNTKPDPTVSASPTVPEAPPSSEPTTVPSSSPPPAAAEATSAE